MANFSDLKITMPEEVKEINFEGEIIKIKQHIPTTDMLDIVELAIQNSAENGYYNPMKLDVFFSMYLVYTYSDLEFTEEEKKDIYSLFDVLKCSGLLEEIIGNIPSEEYQYMVDSIDEISNKKSEYSNSFAGVLTSLIADLPKQAEAMKNIFEDFDPEKYQAVMGLAKATGADFGGAGTQA